MITEDYVSYEVAKLLKEKGFDLLTDKVYDNQNKLDYQNVICWQEKRLPYISAPTHQMAMKWLREVHKVHISIYPFNRELPITDEFYYTCDIATSKLSSKEGHLRGVWKTYEEAVEELESLLHYWRDIQFCHNISEQEAVEYAINYMRGKDYDE